jgi:hypothetical protein
VSTRHTDGLGVRRTRSTQSACARGGGKLLREITLPCDHEAVEHEAGVAGRHRLRARGGSRSAGMGGAPLLGAQTSEY